MSIVEPYPTSTDDPPKSIAEQAMDDAVRYIDKTFGKGFAKRHPELIAAFMQTTSVDYLGFCITQGLEGIAEAIANSEHHEGMLQ